MTNPFRRPARPCALIGAGLAAGLLVSPLTARETYPPLQVLLQSGETVLGQPLAYPEGAPAVTAAIVTMAPGQQTGWHRHDAPLFAYMLEGQLTVDYGDGVKKTYAQGDALLEAVGTDHQGENTGEGPMRILVVFAGAEGVQNTVMRVE